MSAQNLSAVFHQRLHLPDYDERLAEFDPAELDNGEANSPNQVWGREQLRGRLDLADVDKSPVDLLVWGIGAPLHLAGTKIGGFPAWPAGRPLPMEERNDWETPTPLRFFAQINLADSADLLPDFPGKLLSIWGDGEFPYGSSLRTFWLDLEGLELVTDYDPGFDWDFMPSAPLFAALHRTWDRSRRQELLDESAALEGVRIPPCATSWMASKIGGQATEIQGEADLNDARFFLQLQSITPAVAYPHAWVSEIDLKITGSNSSPLQQNTSLNLADGGAFYFFATDWGSVEPVFQFH